MKINRHVAAISFKSSIKQVFILLTLICCFQIHGQVPGIEWQNALGGSLNDFGWDAVQTPDNGYIITGIAGSNNGDVSGNNGNQDGWLVKLNNAGVIQWQNALGGPGTDFLYELKDTSDGGYISIGTSDANGGDVTGNHGLFDFWVTKLNSSGDLQWQKSLGGSQDDFGRSIVRAVGGGYVLAGSASSNDGDVTGHHGEGDFWIVKIGATGSIEWKHAYGGSLYEVPHEIISTNDGGFMVVGETSSNDGDVTGQQGLSDFWVVKLNEFGVMEWQKTYGGSDIDSAASIKQTSDGGYIVVGQTRSNDGDVSGNNGNYDVWVIKISASGILQWQKTLGGSDIDTGNGIIITPNRKYVISAQSRSNNGDVSGNHGQSDAWVALLFDTGDVQWQNSIGGSDVESAESIIITNDGGYLVSGFTWSNNGDVNGNHGGSDVWIVKLAPDPLEIEDFTLGNNGIYPNPATDILHLESKTAIDKVSVFDMLGKEILSQETTNTIDVSALSPGIYIVQLSEGKSISNHKLIKN